MIRIDAQRLRVSKPDRDLFRDLSVTVLDDDRLGVVGINGTGKSTLLRVLAGTETPDEGVVHVGRGTRIAVLDQTAELADGTARTLVGDDWESLAMLDRLGMSDVLDRDVRELSGGQRKRIALARALVTPSDVLILDEPTNHLDVDAIEWLEEHLGRYRGALILVTHDRHVLDKLTTKVLELDRGGAYLHTPSGEHEGSGYAAYLAGRAERAEQAETTERSRRNLARTELAWLRRGAPARTSKPKARIEAATALIADRPLAAARGDQFDLASLGATRLGSKVVELHDVGHRYGDGPWLVRHLDLIVEPGDRLGIVGVNGAGKSTLLDVIAGKVTPTEGRVEVGSTVVIGYHDQLGQQLDPDMRVRDAVAGPLRPASWEDDRLLDRFWFDSDARFSPIRLLSGGERRRLQLVMTLAAQPNVLLLDEPTNDLDLDTLRALEDFLEDWPGALVTVSHDRAFLERVVEFAVAIEGGTAGLVRGGMAGWLAARRERQSANPAPRSLPRTEAASTPRSTSPDANGATSSGDGASKSTGSKPRTSYTLGRLLRDVERDLDRAMKRRDQLTGELTGTTDHEVLRRLGAELAVVQTAVHELEERWLALAEEDQSR